jgi:chloramphenicol-sensitive protein RarD
MLESSLGYFINPLVNVLLAVIFLREKLNRLQIASLLLATAGVVQLALQGTQFPWIALILAFSFGFYGLFRKKLTVDPLSGSFLESVLLCGPALAFLAYQAPTGQTYSTPEWALLVFAGIVTALPLLWFVEAAQRTPLSIMGFLQYISPCLQFSLAIFAFGEPFLPVHARSFACIWVALAVFTADLALRRGI